MSQALPLLALSDTMTEEARSVVATAIAQIINFIRTMVVYALEVVRRLMTYASENPLAFTLAIANVIIWIS